MHTGDITESAAQLQHARDRIGWQIDWLLLDAEAISEDGLRDALYDLRLAAVTHGSVLTEVVERVEFILGRESDAYRLSCAMQPVMESLIQLRITCVNRSRTREALPLAFAFERFQSAVEQLLTTEQEIFSTCGTLLFPAETW